ncbi:prepilin-type N-terminal cleavage/methylation domain-containing protein [Bacillus sp. AGMB 02131]|uniref:Prepilin-type N-terminal cleavage/methylation domain-containing protein n=1 Tax=Peribacillus faecalis TaxID=2772559 RepID=A0A927CU07_9BACI|nr:prepilin-type N-terminal cleavage/methylation domain-containing protein [Peribacillus faecalis]MBD3107823.1 prepilin-type N-terminal cleavage/methylation domain-containing protein [Peribacillus faecalis]
MKLKDERGITLVEVLLALTITAIIGGSIYGVLHQTINAKEKSESHNTLRQEANIVMTKLRAIHENSGDLDVEKGGGSSEVIFSSNGSPFVDESEYTIKLDTLKSSEWDIVEILKNDSSTTKTFNSESDIEVTFTIEDKHNNEYELKTTLSGEQRKKDVSINGSYRLLVNKEVFLYSSAFDTGSQGNPNIYGDGASIVITGKNGLDFSGLKGNSSSIEVTSFYINGPLIRDGNSKLGDIGTDNPKGELYVNGDMILKTNGGGEINNIYGQVYVNGNLNIDGKFRVVDSLKYKGTYTGKNTDKTNIERDPNIPSFEFYSFTTRNPDWYTVKRGYTVHKATINKTISIGDNSKVYIESKNITADVSGENMVVVSEGDIIVSGGGSGVLFAPKGNVTFDKGTFTGVIVAKNINLNKAVLKSPPDIQQFFKDLSIGSDEEFPLIIDELLPSN